MSASGGEGGRLTSNKTRSAMGAAPMAWIRYTPGGTGPIPPAEIQAWAGRCSVAVIDPWEVHAAQQLKEIAPDTVVLCRKNFAAVDEAEAGPVYSSGISYARAERDAKWFAVDRSGERIAWEGAPQRWQMRVWDPAYRTAWVAGVLKELQSSAFDGVLAVGDIEESPRLDLPLPDLGSRTQQREANDHLFAEAGEALAGAGKLLVASVGDARRSPARWARLARWGGVFESGWMATVGGRILDPGTARQQTHTLVSDGPESVPAPHLAIVRTPVHTADQPGTSDARDAEQALVRYGLAAFWVFGGGHGTFAASSPDGRRGLWIPEMAWDLGDPIQEPDSVVNLWSRTFTKGWAAVNLASDGRRRRHVTLPTGYVLPDGSEPPEQVVLSAHEGILLRRDF